MRLGNLSINDCNSGGSKEITFLVLDLVARVLLWPSLDRKANILVREKTHVEWRTDEEMEGDERPTGGII